MYAEAIINDTTTGRFHHRATWDGIRDAVPIVAGLAPLALALGAAIAESGTGNAAGWATSALIYGASAQLAAVTVMGADGTVLAVITAVAAINARAVVYSAALQARFRTQPRWFRAAGPYLLVDPLFALVSGHCDPLRSPADARRYYLAAGLTIWGAWQPLVGLGVLFGPAVPKALSLEFAVPILLIALLMPAVRTAPAAAATAAGLLTGTAGTMLPAATNVMIAAAAGAAAATLARTVAGK